MTILDAFLEPENQTMLWNFIRQTSLFKKTQIRDSDMWFQTIMEKSYQKAVADPAPSRDFYHGVLTLNKNTLQMMLDDLQKMFESQPVENRGMSLSDMIDNDTKMKFEGTADKPLKNLEDLVKERIESDTQFVIPPPFNGNST